MTERHTCPECGNEGNMACWGGRMRNNPPKTCKCPNCGRNFQPE